jgi:hypothetical protein
MQATITTNLLALFTSRICERLSSINRPSAFDRGNEKAPI